MGTQVDKVVKVFKAVAQYPTPTAAKVLKPFMSGSGGVTVVSSWSQRNLERGKSIKFQQTHFIDLSQNKTSDMLPVDISLELLSCNSKTEEFRGVIREVSQDSNKKQFLEVWKQWQLWKTYDLHALEVHGEVYADGDFGSFDWDPSENKLLYIAEKKIPKTEPFYKSKPQETRDNIASGDGKVVRGEEYVYRPDWGEQLVGKHQPVVSVCDTKNDSISIIEGIPQHFSPGQVFWTLDGDGIVGVVWKNEPRRLGLIYCTNRHSYIFHLSADGTFNLISDDGMAVRSPRFSPDGKYLVWLERQAGGPHHAGHKLVCCNWKTKEKEVIVDIVRQQMLIAGNKIFFGLYNQSLPKRCWTEDSQRILLSTPQKYSVNSYVVNIETKSVTELQFGNGSQCVLDVYGDVVVCSRSSVKLPPCLVVGRLPQTGKEHNIQWSSVTNWQSATPALEALTVHCMNLTQDEDSSATCKSFSAIYVGPSGSTEKGVPLIIWPHGGPHSAFTNSYFLEAALFSLLGFGVLMVNYRGSIGAGQDSVDFLLGKVGDTDVKDVQQAVDDTLKMFSYLSPDKMVLFGGSHGGFLVTHISGQFPRNYKAVVARNPVIDVAAMFTTTDIPDWTAAVSGFPYNALQEMSLEAFEKMKRCSPIHYVSNVIAPTLLLIGKNDNRVPSSQGIHYYHNLRANNVKTRLLLYDDNHPLSQVPVEMDNLINSVLWFLQHI